MISKPLHISALLLVCSALASEADVVIPLHPPSRSVFKITEKISKGGPQLSVEAIKIPTHSNSEYEIRIAIEGRPLQSIHIRNGQPLKADDLQLVDLTTDGFLDIMIASGRDHRDKPWFKTLIYSQGTQQYQWIGQSSTGDQNIKITEQAGAGQPATKPADKAPANIQLPTSPSKDGPR